MTNEMIEKGKRINGRRANAERYIPFYEFLLFDPLYRKMNEKAKILYIYLRNKVKYFEHENERYEQGEGTKSYIDEDGNTFIVADNTELSYILNCAESTLIRIKKEISSYGLLEEVKRKDKSNQLYPLEPETLSEAWEHIEEIKNNREAKIKKGKEKHSAFKENKKHEDTASFKNLNNGNLQNESYGNLQNESYGNLQNESEIQSKNYKSNLINLNNKSKNLSIEENIKNTELPLAIQETLLKNRDRLIDSSLDLQDIVVTVNAFLENTPINTINYVLDTMLNNAKTSIKNFRNYFSKSLNNYYENLQNQKGADKKAEKKSNEVVPDWFQEQKEEKAKKTNKPAKQEQEITQEELNKMLQELRNHSGSSNLKPDVF